MLRDQTMTIHSQALRTHVLVLGHALQRLCSRLLPRRRQFDSPSAGEPKRNMRRRCATRRPAVPVTECTAASVLCLVPCFYFSMRSYLTQLDTMT